MPINNNFFLIILDLLHEYIKLIKYIVTVKNFSVHLNSFYKIYYNHRVKKASLPLKIYIFLTLPINYLINKFFFPSVINLEHYSNKNKFLFEKDLGFLFQYFNSDKGEKLINQYNKPIYRDKHYSEGHSYHIYYEKFFNLKKNNQIDLLELGSFKGNASAAFYFYFKNCKIISCDLFPDLFLYKSERIKNFKIDSGSESELNNKLLKNDYKFDIIVEDAGHFLKDQIISLFILFKTLKSKGFFVIEELDFPDKRKDMNIFNEKPTLREILLCVKNNQDFSSKYITNDQKKYFLDNVDQINIFKGTFHEIAFITKR